MFFPPRGLKEETFNERLKWRSASDIDSSSGEESCQGLAFWSTIAFWAVDAFSIVGTVQLLGQMRCLVGKSMVMQQLHFPG